MSQGQILVSPEELRGHGSYVGTQAQTTEQNFQALKGRLDQLQSAFQGQAASAFQARFEEWNRSGIQLIQALQALGKFLNDAANTIEQTDQQLAGGLR